jgi:hypothetical protein
MADEIRQRMTPSAFNAVPTSSPSQPLDEELYWQYFKRALHEVIEEDLPPKLSWPTFEDWYNDRLGWAAAGGAPGFKINWGDSRERLNKRGALLSLPYEHVKSMLRHNENPLHYSKGAVKFEKGKKRAIWNTSIYHYLYQAYILDCLDSHLRSSTHVPDGPSPANWNTSTHHAPQRLATQFERLSSLADSQAVGLMWDFSDFNINHSLRTMVELFRTLGTALKDRNTTTRGPSYLAAVQQDFSDCIDWISKARMNTILDAADRDNPIINEILRSLQSGERATSFTNTFENRIYLKIADYTAHQLLARPLLTNPRSQQGDDVFAVAHSLWDAILECGLLNISGAAGQNYKITLDYTGRGEYLRYAYDATSRTVSGYPVRSGLGLISGEFFMDPIVDPDSRAVAYLEAFNRANLRGAILPTAFLDALIHRNCSVSYTTRDGRKHRVTGDLDFALTPAAFGGLGATGYPPMTKRPNGKVRIYRSKLQRPTFTAPTIDSSKAFKNFRYSDQVALHNMGLGQELSRSVHDLAANSVLTGAYRGPDLSSAIAKYAEKLDAFKHHLTLEYTDLPQHDFNPKLLKNEIIRAWLDALGLAQSPPQDAYLTPGLAIAIPSGGGKSTLARQYPHLFIDHDDYVPYSQVKTLVEQQMWPLLNRSHATRPIPLDGRVLLTWSPDTAPNTFRTLEVPLVSNFEGPRLFADNLAHLQQTAANLICYYKDFDTRSDHLVSLASEQLARFKVENFKPTWGAGVLFQSSRAPIHHYGSAAIYTRPAGFSLQEALVLAVDALPPAHPFTGRFGRWMRLWSYISPETMPSSHREILDFLKAGLRDDTLNTRIDYFLGKMSWLPPAIQNHSPDILTLARDISLKLLEEYCTRLFLLDHKTLILCVAQLEIEVTYLFETIITPTYLRSARFLG